APPEVDGLAGDVFRICFHGEFGILRDFKTLPNAGRYRGKMRAICSGGGAPSEVDAVDPLSPPPVDLAQQRVDVPVLEIEVRADRERTIGAVHAAEGKVHVKA